MAKTAKDYKVTTPYGWVAGYPINNGFHTGEDRAMPTGTPVVVNKTKIGLADSTGYSTGSHLHLGRYGSRGHKNPRGSGFRLRTVAGRKPTVVETGYDKWNGNYVKIRNWQGNVFVYLHLKTINVKKGQVIK